MRPKLTNSERKRLVRDVIRQGEREGYWHVVTMPGTGEQFLVPTGRAPILARRPGR